ncbi:hypothetical protein [Streptomyces sp. NPDC018000]|uniref:hypothetical protein n=1 Tax=Streptomyces sp. NPDC018000 TaxID=3365028 RepID=UPI0037BD4E0A
MSSDRANDVAGAAGALAVHRQGVGPGRVASQQVGEADPVDDPADRRRTRRDAHGVLAEIMTEVADSGARSSSPTTANQ